MISAVSKTFCKESFVSSNDTALSTTRPSRTTAGDTVCLSASVLFVAAVLTASVRCSHSGRVVSTTGLFVCPRAVAMTSTKRILPS